MDIVLFKNSLLLLIILVAVIIDWRTTKIPNLLTFPAAAIGIILNYVIADWHGALMACAGWLLAALIVVFLGNLPLGPGGASGGIGMGDAKLLAAIGAFLGPKSVLLVIIYFCLFFGLMSCVALATKVPWKQLAVLVSTAIFDGDTSGINIDTTKLTEQRKASMPISLAILAGALITICFENQTLAFLGFQ
jgi:prepilin peptidase CpaA